MRVVVMGGTGHVGPYLVPRLVAWGHEVVVFSRGQRRPYQPHAAWKGVYLVTGDRLAEEQAGRFGARGRALQPDAVIDLICFEVAGAQQIVEALQGQMQHFLHCGTIWVHGPSVEVPTTEDQPRRPFGDYGIKKAAIAAS
jgi:nucleoside-diphosphate-sugar epimerase